jgi:hypothetical protein
VENSCEFSIEPSFFFLIPFYLQAVQIHLAGKLLSGLMTGGLSSSAQLHSYSYINRIFTVS